MDVDCFTVSVQIGHEVCGSGLHPLWSFVTGFLLFLLFLLCVKAILSGCTKPP